jgi:hypothetical protein
LICTQSLRKMPCSGDSRRRSRVRSQWAA